MPHKSEKTRPVDRFSAQPLVSPTCRKRKAKLPPSTDDLKADHYISTSQHHPLTQALNKRRKQTGIGHPPIALSEGQQPKAQAIAFPYALRNKPPPPSFVLCSKVNKQTSQITPHLYYYNRYLPHWTVKSIKRLTSENSQHYWYYTNRLYAGAFGGFHLAIDADHQIWGIKSFRTQPSHKVNLEKKCYPTSSQDMLYEIMLQNTFSPKIAFHYVLKHQSKCYAFLPAMSMNGLQLREILNVCIKCTQNKSETGFSYPHTISKLLLLDVAQTLTHLHSQRFVHGDLTLNNLLLHPDGHFILSDFGKSRAIPSQKSSTNTCGAFYTQAPEVLQHYLQGDDDDEDGNYYLESDIYSLAKVIALLLNPHQDALGLLNARPTAENYYNNQLMFHQWLKQDPTKKFMLSHYWHERWHSLFTDPITHHWQDLLKSMLALRPEQRPTAQHCYHWAVDHLSAKEIHDGRHTLRHLAKIADKNKNRTIEWMKRFAQADA